MPLTGMNEESIKNFEKQLFTEVPELLAIGNSPLMRALSLKDSWWTTDRYWAIRNRLIDQGLLEKWKGKGGSVRRSQRRTEGTLTPPSDTPPETTNADPYLQERSLYEPMLKVIKENWSVDYGFDDVVAEITAQGGRRADGKWSRPDITLASSKMYPYVPGKQFDVITFEIKPTESVDVTAVYEALAHRRAAKRAYALLHVPEDRRQEYRDILEDIEQEARRVGVGVLLAGKPDDYETWEELVEAVSHEPDPQRLNDFLAKQVSDGFRDRIQRWLR